MAAEESIIPILSLLLLLVLLPSFIIMAMVSRVGYRVRRVEKLLISLRDSEKNRVGEDQNK